MEVYGELKAAIFENLAADPTGTGLVPGRVWFNTTDKSPKLYTGTDIVDLDNKALSSSEYTEQLTTPTLPLAGQHTLYFKADGTPYVLDSEGNDTPLGSGSGGGAKNYIADTNSNIENTIGDWVSDDGTGTVSTGLTLSTTDVVGEFLVGTKSLKITKDAVDRSGHFVKILTDTVDPADRGRVLYGSFEFKPLSGYVSADIIVEAYDVTNSAVLYSGVASDLELMNAQGKVQWVTHTQDTTAQIELRLKVANVNTNAFDVVIDDVRLGPAATLQASVERETSKDLTGSGDFTSGTIRIRRTGKMVTISTDDIVGHPSSTAPDAAPGFLPEWARPTTDATNVVAHTADHIASMTIRTDGSFRILYRDYTGSTTFSTTLSDTATMTYSVDSDSTIISLNELSNRGAFLQAANNSVGTHTASGSFQKFPFQLVIEDTHGAYNSGLGEYTCPADGFVVIGTSIGFAANATGSRIIRIARNGAAARNLAQYPGDASASNLNTYSAVLKVSKGDVLSIEGFQNSGGSLDHSSGTLFFEVKYINDLTTLGVVKNYEVIEERNIVLNSLAGTLNVWQELDPGWFIDVPEGTFRISGETLIRHYTPDPTDTAFCSLVLSTAADVASFTNASIVAGTRGSSFSSVQEPGRYQKYTVERPEYVSTGVRLKWFVIAGNISGNSSLTELVLVNNLNGSFGQGRITAERLK